MAKKCRKKVRLKTRRDQIKKEIDFINKRKRQNLREKSEAVENKRKKAIRNAKVLYGPEQRILLLGEGDFSFSKAILDVWNTNYSDATDNGYLVSTCLDSKEELYEKYSDARNNIKSLRKSNLVKVLTKVNAMNLESVENRLIRELSLTSCPKFDRIVFNFPHLGDGERNKDQSIKNHQELLRHAASSCHKYLSDTGELHITTKLGEPYSKWKVGGTVQSSKLFKLKTTQPFLPSIYPGYIHRRTVGAAFKSESEGGPVRNADITKIGAMTYIFSPFVSSQ